jgi:hypothetical protein
VGVKLLLVAAIVVLLGAAGSARAADPALVADVGANDSFSISLKDASGSKVTHLEPGTYSLTIHDHSSIHNFHLDGPGVDESTEIPFVGDKTVSITVGDGTYFFECDAHAAQMRGTFTAGTVSTPPPPVPAPVAKLAGSIGPGTAFALRPHSGLRAGKAVLAVADRSRTDGFRLAGPGISRSTGAAFKGTVRWAVTLKAGRYTFGSVRVPKRRSAFTVSR